MQLIMNHWFHKQKQYKTKNKKRKIKKENNITIDRALTDSMKQSRSKSVGNQQMDSIYGWHAIIACALY